MKGLGFLLPTSLPAIAGGLALLALSPQANATVIVDDGQCGGSPSSAQCTAKNTKVIATAKEIKEIQPVNGNAGWTNFQNAFNSWNNTLAKADQWTLAVDNLAAEAILDVTLYRAYVNEGNGCGIFCGGAEIKVTYSNGGNPPNPISSLPPSDGDAIWSQSIVTNQKRNPSLPGNPYLDNAPGTPDADLGPPAYPFQYETSFFYDKPSRNATADWLADAWISSEDNTNHILTVYDGLEWGFTVTPIPEISTWAMMLVGFGGLVFVARHRRSRPFAASLAA